jgi:hypothetical protein
MSDTSPPTSPCVDKDSARLRPLTVELRAALFRVKRAIDAEIAAYPTPIPRCDAQFNHLYEERSRLASLLERLDSALESGDAKAIAETVADIAFAPAAREDAAVNGLRAQIERAPTLDE